jgi:hypothetical protein
MTFDGQDLIEINALGATAKIGNADCRTRRGGSGYGFHGGFFDFVT